MLFVGKLQRIAADLHEAPIIDIGEPREKGGALLWSHSGTWPGEQYFVFSLVFPWAGRGSPQTNAAKRGPWIRDTQKQMQMRMRV